MMPFTPLRNSGYIYNEPTAEACFVLGKWTTTTTTSGGHLSCCAYSVNNGMNCRLLYTHRSIRRGRLHERKVPHCYLAWP